MRMRKKKWAEPYLEAHRDFAYDNPIEYKGRWKDLLHCQQLHVELGMGKGDYINAMAHMYPEIGWIGLEKDISAGAVAARKALSEENMDLHNKRMIINRAEDMLQWFEPGEIDVIHLNFSDPWPKKKAHKKRLSSDQFLTMYQQLLTDDGMIRMKTDNQDLFEDSVVTFSNHNFIFLEFSVDYRRAQHPEDAVTEYESKFMQEGKPIYQLCAHKPKPEMIR